MKTWQWIIGLAITIVLAIFGSLWSVGIMRADDMQRVARAEIRIENLERDRFEMKEALRRIEEKVDEIRKDEVAKIQYPKRWSR